jgi:hypothetical protein
MKNGSSWNVLVKLPLAAKVCCLILASCWGATPISAAPLAPTAYTSLGTLTANAGDAVVIDIADWPTSIDKLRFLWPWQR